MGHHNTSKTPDHPSCWAGGTVPVVEVGGEWIVPGWALWYIRRGKVVLRYTNNTNATMAHPRGRAQRRR